MVKRQGRPEGAEEKLTVHPSRRCLVSGESRPCEELVRFVADPEGAMIPDVSARLPGRGYWVAAQRNAVDEAIKRNQFLKAAARHVSKDGGDDTKKSGVSRKKVSVAVDLADQVERLLAKRCLELLGLARRAGELVTGFEKVRERLKADDVLALLTASDASADGAEKLQNLAANVSASGVKKVGIFSREELGLALGRENVVHAALRRGGIGNKFLIEAGRLSGFRQADGPVADHAGTIGNKGSSDQDNV